jgi:hypothetical protein
MPKGHYDRTLLKRNRASKAELMVPHPNARNLLDREKDRWFAVKMVAQGMTYKQVAEKIHELNPEYTITAEGVRLEVEKALVDWKRENMENIDAYIAKELWRINEIEKLVMENFEMSKKGFSPKDYAAMMKRGMTPDEVDEMYKDRELAGDPKFLDILLNLQTQRMRLLGINKGNDVAQNTIVQYNFNNIGEDALEKMADMLQDTKYKEIADEQ